MSSRFRTLAAPNIALSLVVLAAVAVVYWPVHAATFFWDDRIYIHDIAWMRSGDWWQHAFGGIFDSGDFFRPLVIILFAGESVLFDTAAEPMHVVSLGLHLANTLLVGLIAGKLAPEPAWRGLRSTPLLAMLVFGLHPLLIEPVAWISGQFDLVVTLFALAGLHFNLILRNTAARCFVVATCFFLAACSKEAAISFPLLLVICDWQRAGENSPATPIREAIAIHARKHWPVYSAVAVAGFIYLGIRYAALGYLVQAGEQPHLAVVQRLQLVCGTYAAYWRVMVFPMTGTGLLHSVPYEQFAHASLSSLTADAFTVVMLVYGVTSLARRRPVGAMIGSVSAALLPVLHLVPIEFDPSYYHDRYATLAVAMGSALLPAAIAGFRIPLPNQRLIAAVRSLAVIAWLLAAVASIRVTLPLWTDELLLWKWAYRQDSGSVTAMDMLLSSYLLRNDLVQARPLADKLEVDGRECPACLLNVAVFAIATGDSARAATALALTKKANRYHALSRVQVIAFILASGDLKALQGDLAGAETAYRDAIKVDPLVPGPYMSLANALVRQAKFADGRNAAKEGLALYASDVRDARAKDFQRILEQVDPAARSSGH